MRSRGNIDWGSVFMVFATVAVVLVAVGAFVWAVQQPTCYGVEPDGEVETLWPCPAPHKDGERFTINEDEFEGREID